MHKTEYCRKYRAANIEKERERWRKKARRRYASGVRHNPSAQRRAQASLRNAVAAGAIVKPDHCSKCGLVPELLRSIQAHHRDYSKPLEVVWLCSSCHGLQHRKEAPEPLNRAALAAPGKESEQNG